MRRFWKFVGICLCLAGCTSAGYEQSLQGEWRFAIDPEDKGTSERWYDSTLEGSIRLPGSLQEQGYGEEVGMGTQWTGQIVDKSWYDAPQYAPYRREGNIKVPFWLNPDKHYVGVAWYQKEVEIPEEWAGRPVRLELERTHWQTTLFLDGVEMGRHESLSTPCRHVFTALEPGRHSLTLRVDNRLHVPVGENAHSVSDHTQTNWNGVIGTLRLTSLPSIYLEDLQVYPCVKDKTVEVVATLAGSTRAGEASLLLQVERKDGTRVGTPFKAVIGAEGGAVQRTTLSLGDEAELWSEFQPSLYTLRAVVEAGGKKEEQCRTFGLREFKADGTRFALNGQPVFLRGTLECCIFPLTGYPAMDTGYWRKIYSQCKAYGLNHVRFHSWCPPEAAFEMADSMGVYLQVECAGWATVGDGSAADQWFRDESDRILKEYGNHPSFCLMAYGNEPGGARQREYLADLVTGWKAKDSRRVYTSAAGWPYVPEADYYNTADPRIQQWGGGLGSILNAQAPRTDFDFAGVIRKEMPTVSHEIGQWCVYPNFREIGKYTGLLKAKNFEIFQETLARNGMGDQAEDFLYASGRLQTLCYKADIEAALRTPGFAGFQLLDLHDFPGQGTALVGVLDPFWEEKGYVTAEEYSTFCNRTVPLARFPKMVWLNNETLHVPVELANFGGSPLLGARATWTVSHSSGEVLAQGEWTGDYPVGNGIPMGVIRYDLKGVTAPSCLRVRVEVPEAKARNQWNIWVYPSCQPQVEEPLIASRLDEQAMRQLAQGGKVLLLLEPGDLLPEKGGDIRVGFSSIFWNTAWTRGQAPHTLGILCRPEHPALSAFPTEGFSDYQWWDVVGRSGAMVLEDFPADYRPVVQLIDDWFTNRKLGLLIEGKVGEGKLMVCSADLRHDLDKRPAARQFLQSILQYMASDAFSPSVELQPGWIKGLYARRTH